MKQQDTNRKRSYSDPVIAGGHQANAKLSKPPRVETLHERPRNRLKKRSLAVPPMRTPYPAHFRYAAPTTKLYILEYEPYPYNTLPSKFLGVYSSVDSVTTEAIKNGAYTFSREGFLDGSEYLSATGRIKIQSQLVQQSGTEAAVSTRSRSFDNRSSQQTGLIRSDIPHPESRSNTLNHTIRPDATHPGAQSTASLNNLDKQRDLVFLAIRQGPIVAHCLGMYARPSLAWGACLKNKATCALSGTLSEESREINANGMPAVTARLRGCGQQTWFVVLKEVDAPAR